MKLITQQDLVRSVAIRWRRQYEPFQEEMPRFSWRMGVSLPPLDTKQIAEKLDALDLNTATHEQVAEIIGNRSWTRLECSECHRSVTEVVSIGESGGYLCRDCIKKASEL